MNKKRNTWSLILLILFVIILVIIIVYITSGSNTELNQSQFNTLLESRRYSGKTVEWTEISSFVGDNSVEILGKLKITGDKKYINFRSELSKSFYDSVQTQLTNFGLSVKDRNCVAWWKSALIQFVPMLLFISLITFFMFRTMKSGDGLGNPFSMGKSKAKQIISNVKFSDVAGINEEKIELIELVDYLKNPQKYAQMGARAPKGVLMEGPPGTGKTLLAKAVAGEAGVPFFSISGSEFEEMFVGVGASRIREMFATAKKSSPCIIFIDEIDAVGRKRRLSIGGGNDQTLNQLLTEMDGFGTNSGVIIMAATNRVDVLDDALLRPGRFDRQIQISLPDINEREAILLLHARNKNISSEIVFRRIAQRTPGFSGAQLENVLNEAAILAVRKNKNVISLLDVDEAIDRVVGGPAKRSRAMTANDKLVVSYHEAGHALIGLRLEHASKVQKVTIIPRGHAGGYTIMTPKEETYFESKENLFASITGFLGGRAAEEIKFGKTKITTGAYDDLEKATIIARRMVTVVGMSSLGLIQFESHKDNNEFKNRFSENVGAKIDAEIKMILDDCYESAKDVISANMEYLELISESLQVLETITAEQIEYINENKALPPEVIEEKQRSERIKQKEEKGELFQIKPNKKPTNDNK